VEKQNVHSGSIRTFIFKERRAFQFLKELVPVQAIVKHLKPEGMSVWQEVALDSLVYHGLPCLLPNPSMPCRRATPKTGLWPFQVWPTHRAAPCGCLLPLWTPHAIRLCLKDLEYHVGGRFKILRLWLFRRRGPQSGRPCYKITFLIMTENTKYALRMADPPAADKPAGGWLPKGCIITTP
jgi:hypothetical protein